ncbi:MAG: hypothetical protein NVS3B10_26880 [Polyangiales bacterium]
MDDSGPVIPLVHAGAGASGMAVLGAAAFHDEPLLSELVTALELTAFPERTSAAEFRNREPAPCSGGRARRKCLALGSGTLA